MQHLAPADRAKAVAALATAVLLWGSAFVGIRLVVSAGAYSPGALSFARLTVASVCLLALCAARGGLRIPTGWDWVPFVALGAMGQMLYQLLLNTGERTVDAGTASLLVAFAPVLASLMAVVFLGERMRAVGWAGTAIAFAGAATVATASGVTLRLGSDVMLVVLATCLWAAYLVVQKTVSDRYDSLELTAWPMWIGTVLLSPWAPDALRAVALAPAASTLAVVWLGVMCSVAGFMVWSYAMRRLPVVIASNALFTVPAAAFVIGLVFLGEHPAPMALSGGMLSIAGVVLAQSKALKEF